MKNRIKFAVLLFLSMAVFSFSGCVARDSSVSFAPALSGAEGIFSSDDPREKEPLVSLGETLAEEPEVLPEPAEPEYLLKQYDVPAGDGVFAENLTTRGLVSVKADKGCFISWRSMLEDDGTEEFVLKRNGKEVYRGSKTCYADETGKAGDKYSLTVEGREHEESTICASSEYMELTLCAPEDQNLPNRQVAVYSANDMSLGDLDGDGELELIVKWYPDNAQDNSNDGITGVTYLDGYDIDYKNMKATLMWRIDLGINIRSGAHYTQYQVWDYNGDGKAELICKTADGTTTYDANLNETGHVGAVSMSELDPALDGRKQDYDFRQYTGRTGRIVLGEEYLTAFDGATGCIIDTVEYVPDRGPYLEDEGIYDTSMWGLKGGVAAEKNDGYANRADRFLAGTAYLDEGNACAVFARGYYGRTAITAWKLVDNKLTLKWYFDADSFSEYAAQGNHQLSINDVDNDGLDEIVYGALCLDHDGTVLYSTGLGHGDAMHVSDFNNDGKLEVFSVHEEKGAEYSVELHDAATGEILWGVALGKDVGRGLAADIDPNFEGAEMWSASRNVITDCNGNVISETKPSVNFSLFWDGDLLQELFDSNDSKELIPQIQKWNYEEQKLEVLLEAAGTLCNNGTKANACLIADFLGDWREEVIVRDAGDASKIRIYTTTIDTDFVFTGLIFDRTYREGIAWQNTGYNQPAHLPYTLTGIME